MQVEPAALRVQACAVFGTVVEPNHSTFPPALTIDAPVKPAVQVSDSLPGFRQLPLKITPTFGPEHEIVNSPLQSVDALQVGGDCGQSSDRTDQ